MKLPHRTVGVAAGLAELRVAHLEFFLLLFGVGKGARDADSAEMIELILATRTADFGVVYGGWESPRSALKEVIDKNRSTDITSYYEKNKKSWDAKMDKVFAAFEELAEKNK